MIIRNREVFIWLLIGFTMFNLLRINDGVLTNAFFILTFLFLGDVCSSYTEEKPQSLSRR